MYGLLLWMDRRGWKGQRVALLSIVGFGLVIFSYTVVNLYFSRAHTLPMSPATDARLLLLGWNFRTAGEAVRERVAFTADEIREATPRSS